MCGIAGYVGNRPAVDTAIGNLKRLEYRGYDSAGVAYPNGDGIDILKAAGKIVNLETLVRSGDHVSRAAIAHTRWATHGRPNEANAHPHADCRGQLAVVHNGIVENYVELRERLRSAGHEFVSETDTEVIAHLLEESVCDAGPGTADYVQALLRGLPQLRGSYALAVVSQRLGDAVFVARKDSPLVVGLGDGENFIASDIPAVLAYTRRVVALEDGDCALIRCGDVQVFGADGKPRDRAVVTIDWDVSAAERGGYEHFMLKEIHEGPEAVRGTLRGRLLDDGSVRLTESEAGTDRLHTLRKVSLVGCGTAYHACLVGKRVIEDLLRTPVDAAMASEFRYGDPLVDAQTLVVAVSQSGETADTLAAVREAKRRGACTLAVVNVVGSTLARETDAALYTQAGPEIGVASTKAYLAQLTALSLLGLHLARRNGAASDDLADLSRGLRAIPEQIAMCLQLEPEIVRLAAALAGHTSFFYLGRGYDYAAALEAALKLKEISYIHAEAYAAGEMKHGPLALIERNVAAVGICTQSRTHEKMASNLMEVQARGGTVVAIVRADLPTPDGVTHVLRIPSAPEPLMPTLVLPALQLLAYHVARLRGCPIDQPRNLAKSVTVE